MTAALPPLVDVPTLLTRPGARGADENDAEAVLADASALVRSYTEQTWTDDDDALTEVPDIVQTVVIQVAARVLRNPQGATDQTVGPYAAKFGPQASEGLYLTGTEKRMLNPFRLSKRDGLWTQQVTRAGDGIDTVFVDDNFGGDSIAMYDSNEVGQV